MAPAWWWVVDSGGALAPAQGNEVNGQVQGHKVRAGPFPTRYAAQLWIKQNPGGGSSGGGTPAQWWVVYDLPAQTSLIAVQGTEVAGQVRANGKTYNMRAGPFGSESAAEQWIGEHQGAGAPGSTGNTGTTDIPVPNPIPGGQPIEIPNPFGGVGGAVGAASGVTEVGHFLGVLVSNLTDVHLWISMGWLWLGFTLILIGLLLWFRQSQAYANLESAALKAIP